MIMKSFIGNVKAWLTFSSTSRPHKVLKEKLIGLKGYLNRNPKLKTKLIHILDYIPALKKRLQIIGKVQQKEYNRHILLTENHLSPEEKTLYLELKKLQNIHLKEL